MTWAGLSWRILLCVLFFLAGFTLVHNDEFTGQILYGYIVMIGAAFAFCYNARFMPNAHRIGMQRMRAGQITRKG